MNSQGWFLGEMDNFFVLEAAVTFIFLFLR